MKLITTTTELKMEFRRLIKQYDNFYWATAWAADSSLTLFKDLLAKKIKIQKIVVGMEYNIIQRIFLQY